MFLVVRPLMVRFWAAERMLPVISELIIIFWATQIISPSMLALMTTVLPAQNRSPLIGESIMIFEPAI